MTTEDKEAKLIGACVDQRVILDNGLASVPECKKKCSIFMRSGKCLAELYDFEKPASEKEICEIYSQVFESKRLTCRKAKPDNVNHPAHYQGAHECIEVMQAMFGVEAVKAFCRCNAFKYRFRADRKNGEEDIKKAEWYEDYLMKLCDSERKEHT